MMRPHYLHQGALLTLFLLLSLGPAFAGPARAALPAPGTGAQLNAAVIITATATRTPGSATNTATSIPTATPTAIPPCGLAWRVVASPNAGGAGNYLNGAAVVAVDDIWAVGYYYNGNGDQTLVEHWDGAQWRVVPSPHLGILTGVAAKSADDIWAVGYYDIGNFVFRTLAEHWDGTSWTVVSSPNPGTNSNALYGVAAVATTDIWAVGYYENGNLAPQTLVEHWDGTSWTVVPSPNVGAGNNFLYGVAAVTATDVWAVGGAGGTLTLHWNGMSWAVVPSPSINIGNDGLNSVAVVATDDVWAVGDNGNFGNQSQALTKHWNGTSWAVVSSPNPGIGNRFYSVGPVTTNDVWALGYSYVGNLVFQTLSEHWDGSSWTVVPSPNLGNFSAFRGVAVVTANNIWGVGDYSAGGYSQTLVAHYADPCGTPSPTSTNTPTATNTPTNTNTPTPTPTDTPTNTNTSTNTATTTPVPSTNTATTTPVPPISATRTTAPTNTAGPSPTPCPLSFVDVQATDYFYGPVLYLACHGVISGYRNGDGTFSFRPYNNTTRAQMVKIVVLGFQKVVSTPVGGGYTFADVPPTFPFFSVIETAVAANIVSGYTCGEPNEPCDSRNRPYFRPYTQVTRGQLSKIAVGAAGWRVVNPPLGSFADVVPNTAFYPFVETAYYHGIISGYSCGGIGEPCDSHSRPYFRLYKNATRGQIAKIGYLSMCCAPPPESEGGLHNR